MTCEEARSLEDILWSIHWHASHGTVNSEVFADLADEALAALAHAPAPRYVWRLRDAILCEWYKGASAQGAPNDAWAELAARAVLALASPSLPASTGADTKISQAYQVIGSLLDRCGLFDSPEGQRALDYFCYRSEADENFLPWPREPFASTGAGEEAERRYPLPSWDDVIAGPARGSVTATARDRNRFLAGAAWQASQSALATRLRSAPPQGEWFIVGLGDRPITSRDEAALSSLPPAGDTVAVKREWLETQEHFLRARGIIGLAGEISRILDRGQP